MAGAQMERNKIVKEMNKIKVNIVIQVIGTVLVIILVSVAGGESKFFRVGPQDDLWVLSVQVSDGGTYALVIFGLAVLSFLDVMHYDYIQPYMAQQIYFSGPLRGWEGEKNRLKAYATADSSMANLRYLFLILLAVTQVDLALFQWLFKETLAFFVLSFKVGKKYQDRAAAEEVGENLGETKEEIVLMRRRYRF